MSDKRRRWLILAISLVLILASVFALIPTAILPGLARQSFPQTNGEISLPGLDAPVDILRDTMGVPHIYASSLHDLFVAQGYVHAQDRFWQMDFWRHIGSGRLAECLENLKSKQTPSYGRSDGVAWQKRNSKI